MNKLSLFQLVMWVVFPALFMACGGRSPVSRDAASLTVIDVESALAHLEDELTLSDLYDTVRYVPLETSDSCLVGAYPSVRVVDGCIVVSSYSGTALCHSFDAQTGRFLTRIGQSGEGPEDYTNSSPCYNARDGLLYFLREPDGLQKYDLQGRYQGRLRLPTRFPMPVQYVFTDSLIVGRFNNRWPATDCVMLSFTPEGQFVDSIFDPMALVGYPPLAGTGYTNLKPLAGGSMLALTTFGGSDAWNSICGGEVYECGGQVKYHADFSDTVHVLKDGHLYPSIVFHTGSRHFPPEGRARAEGYSDKVVITGVKESPERITFFCTRNIYGEEPDHYFGIYECHSGTLRMAPTDGTFRDDIAGFMPYETSLIEAYKVTAWLEEHPEASQNPALAPLLQVKEEDNPVIVIGESFR